jgi:lactate permease
MPLENIYFLLIALLPFILLFLLIIILRWPTLKTLFLTWLLTSIITLTIWKINSIFLLASFIKGTLIALEIILIVFGAIWLIEILKQKGQIKNLQAFLSTISKDARIQVILIAWLFGSLIEGIAGFGTPAALAAPILVSLGFTPILAVITSLIANSTAVSFGAAGTPVLLGLSGLDLDRLALEEISKNIALIHFFASFIIPLFLVYFVISFKIKNTKIKLKYFLEIIPFAMFSWLAFSIPYIIVAYFIGPEVPSIIGGLTGLLIVAFSAKNNFLVPKNVLSLNKKVQQQKNSSSIKSIIPYMIVIFLLTISRTIPPIKETLLSFTIGFQNLFNTSVTYNFSPFFTPSFYLILTSLIILYIYKTSKKESAQTFKSAFTKIKYPALSLIFAVSFVQLLLISGENLSGLESIPTILAKSLVSIFNQGFVYISPFIGAFGAFVTGSNTLSNLLFASLQSGAAESLAISIILVLALQTIGGAVGNMISIHNILAASATVGLKDVEGKVILKTIFVAIIYISIVSLITFIILKF